MLMEESGLWEGSWALDRTLSRDAPDPGFVLENQLAEQLLHLLTLSGDRQVFRTSQVAVGTWASQALEAPERKRFSELQSFQGMLD